MSTRQIHAGKMERQLTKHHYKGTDVRVFEMGEIRQKIAVIDNDRDLTYYLGTLPEYILRLLKRN